MFSYQICIFTLIVATIYHLGITAHYKQELSANVKFKTWKSKMADLTGKKGDFSL